VHVTLILVRKKKAPGAEKGNQLLRREGRWVCTRVGTREKLPHLPCLKKGRNYGGNLHANVHHLGPGRVPRERGCSLTISVYSLKRGKGPEPETHSLSQGAVSDARANTAPRPLSGKKANWASIYKKKKGGREMRKGKRSVRFRRADPERGGMFRSFRDRPFARVSFGTSRPLRSRKRLPGQKKAPGTKGAQTVITDQEGTLREQKFVKR